MWSPARQRFTLRQTVSTIEKADSITFVLAQGAAQLRGHAQAMHGERFFHAFLQAAGGARIQLHQFAMQSIEGALGVGVFAHGVSVLQFLFDRRLMFLGKWSMTLRRLCTWQRWIIAASPACRRTA